ncbi:MAG: hypothetical protein IIY52_00890 [Solobacterium sp.]|nr:hypothetical protein [Erysipelotrichaceae bacterium]MBQ1324553.1 hypothetical protein [Solobacterium sp.]MBQ1446861.1 hypothetical protein [Solobacterium sp.]MBQ2690189.1 hypothetical protein [Solobacterium sp.]MBQ6591815.1 hypothetical protein [Solobacterium sp.]
MIRLMNVRNMDAFLYTVRQCKGDVTVHLDHCGEIHLKQNTEVQKLLADLRPENNELDISVEEPEDTVLILRSMMNGKYLEQ